MNIDFCKLKIRVDHMMRFSDNLLDVSEILACGHKVSPLKI